MQATNKTLTTNVAYLLPQVDFAKPANRLGSRDNKITEPVNTKKAKNYDCISYIVNYKVEEMNYIYNKIKNIAITSVSPTFR